MFKAVGKTYDIGLAQDIPVYECEKCGFRTKFESSICPICAKIKKAEMEAERIYDDD